MLYSLIDVIHWSKLHVLSNWPANELKMNWNISNWHPVSLWNLFLQALCVQSNFICLTFAHSLFAVTQPIPTAGSWILNIQYSSGSVFGYICGYIQILQNIADIYRFRQINWYCNIRSLNFNFKLICNRHTLNIFLCYQLTKR